MAGIRLTDQKPQYRKADGTLAAGGRILFYLTGTSTPKNVFAEPGLTTNLGSEIALDSDGRHSEDIHLADDAAYRIDVQDADDASIPGYPLDNVGGAASAGADIPDPADGADLQVWSTDGTAGGGYWRDVRELADSTGHATTEVWYSDGAGGGAYAPLPAAATYTVPTGGIAIAAGEIRNGTNLMKWGTDTAPAAPSSLSTSKAVTFSGTAFTAVQSCQVTPGAVSVTGQGAQVTPAYTSLGTTGFTANFFAGAENTGTGGSNGDKISGTVPFSWVVYGTCAAP